jgi:Flp pilus assembly protein TadG
MPTEKRRREILPKRLVGGDIARFGSSRKGSILPLVAFAMLALIGAVGLAIDGARLMLMHSSLQRAVDAGGLSAVAKLSTTTLNDEVRKFTTINFADGYVGASLTALSSSLSSDGKTLAVAATATAPTTFMSIFGIQTMSTSAETEVVRSAGGLELVVVLDNTGSMSGSSLTSLKSAAKSLLDILFGDETVGSNLYVGIVPFSQTVNVGSAHTDWLTAGSLAALDWGSTSWGGCVEARDDGYDVTDDIPETRAFDPYYWEDGSNNDWITTTTTVNKTGINTTMNTTNSYKSGLGQSLGPNKYCPAEVTRMTPVKSVLVSAIDAMTAVGNTHINYGAVWGWRMLSPNWRNLWGGDMSTYGLPLDYNTKSMSKAAVIMTDGENTMSSSVYTAYRWLSEGKLGTTNSTKAVTKLNERLTSVCTAMKNAGIVVYTIAFNNPGSSTEALLKSCATQSAFYFDSPGSAELQTAFKEIGDSLSNLRISK